MEEAPAHLGEFLRRLREPSGIGLPEGMMERFGVSKSYAYWLETKWSAPSHPLLEQMLTVYGASDEERLLAYRLRALAPRRPRGSLREDGHPRDVSDALEDADTEPYAGPDPDPTEETSVQDELRTPSAA